MTVAATGVDPGGTVTATVDGDVVDTQSLADGAATLTVGPFPTVGDQVVTIDYAGDGNTASGSTTTSVTVTKPVPPPLADTTTTATADADGLRHAGTGRRRGLLGQGDQRFGPGARG